MMEQRSRGISICQQLKNMGEDITMIAEYGDYCFDGNVIKVPEDSFIPELAACEGNVYFHGYWINRDWLKHDYYETIRTELLYSPFDEAHNMQYAKQISECCSLSLHVRRGDFVTVKRDRPPQVYRLAIECAEQTVENACYFIFSDDLAWCRENAEEMGLATLGDRVVYVEGNQGELAYRDMQLMSICKGNILVGSSAFSYLAALLNLRQQPIIVNGSGRIV